MVKASVFFQPPPLRSLGDQNPKGVSTCVDQGPGNHLGPLASLQWGDVQSLGLLLLTVSEQVGLCRDHTQLTSSAVEHSKKKKKKFSLVYGLWTTQV